MSEPVDDEESEVVGYKRPPKKNQFQKGQSGNPKGRPKKTQSMGGQRTTVERVMTTKIATVVNGRMKKVPLSEAVVLQFAGSASQGNVAAQKELLRLVHQAELAKEAKNAAMQEAIAANHAILERVSAFHIMGATADFEELCFVLGIGFLGDDGEVYLHPQIYEAALALHDLVPETLPGWVPHRLATPHLMQMGFTSTERTLLSRVANFLQAELAERAKGTR